MSNVQTAALALKKYRTACRLDSPYRRFHYNVFLKQLEDVTMECGDWVTAERLVMDECHRLEER